MKKHILIFSFILSFPLYSNAQIIWKDVGNAFPHDGNFPYSFGEYKGELFVAGEFGYAGGLYCPGIARWNGQNWDSVGKGVTGNFVWATGSFCVYNGELFYGGDFTEMDSLPNTKYIAKWNGTNWSSVTNKTIDGDVKALKYKNDLYVGGGFYYISGVPKTKCIARWDGTNWNSMQGGLNGQYPEVRAMAVYKNELYVGGTFEYAADTNIICNYIARWDGTKWDTLGSGVNGYVDRLLVDTINDILYVAGPFNIAGGIQVSDSAVGLARWDGNNWSAMPVAPFVYTIGWGMAMYRGMLFIGGGPINNLSTDTVIAYWDGQNWHPVVPGPNGVIYAMQVYNDELYIGGGFDKIDTLQVNYIARLWMPPVGVEEKKTGNRNQLKIYPNPAGGSFTIEIQNENFKFQNTKLEIIDVKGKLIYQSSITSQKTEIPSKNWAKGIYFVNLLSEGKMVAKEKVVVE